MLQSTLLKDFHHGFSTRDDGDFRDLSAEGGSIMRAQVFETRQVHGKRVVCIEAGATRDAWLNEEADALMTNVAGVAVSVRTADCVPILLADKVNGAVAAVHAGWRGAVANIVGETVRAMGARYGTRAQDLIAAIGPYIGPCCFEVGDDVRAQIDAWQSSYVALGDRHASRAGPHPDIGALVEGQLVHVGVAADAMERVGMCTKCHADKYFSFRRDGDRAGRHLSLINAR